MEIIQILLKNGAIDNNANEMLNLAARECKHPEIIKELIRNYKVDVNAVDDRGETALLMSVRHNSHDVSVKIVQNLLDMGANVNAINNEGQTALHIAIKNNKIEHAICLINNNASLSLLDKNNNTPLDYLKSPINPQIQKALIKRYNKQKLKNSWQPRLCGYKQQNIEAQQQSQPNSLMTSMPKDEGGTNDVKAMATVPKSWKKTRPSPVYRTNEKQKRPSLG